MSSKSNLCNNFPVLLTVLQDFPHARPEGIFFGFLNCVLRLGPFIAMAFSVLVPLMGAGNEKAEMIETHFLLRLLTYFCKRGLEYVFFWLWDYPILSSFLLCPSLFPKGSVCLKIRISGYMLCFIVMGEEEVLELENDSFFIGRFGDKSIRKAIPIPASVPGRGVGWLVYSFGWVFLALEDPLHQCLCFCVRKFGAFLALVPFPIVAAIYRISLPSFDCNVSPMISRIRWPWFSSILQSKQLQFLSYTSMNLKQEYSLRKESLWNLGQLILGRYVLPGNPAWAVRM
ncbi:unnamed protein product [Sphenostylis stenocarpa]|uniref:Uncharacterized protein n=1 Tax=Sphenostylis stenocarpa TaxID=92480 RepID=A0AA86W2N6_9FABA|nr:unnamed protein product [Sphenostylis stenocarpa]